MANTDCPQCGFELLIEATAGPYGPEWYCSNTACDFEPEDYFA